MRERLALRIDAETERIRKRLARVMLIRDLTLVVSFVLLVLSIYFYTRAR
jgi:hypothetical protein